MANRQLAEGRAMSTQQIIIIIAIAMILVLAFGWGRRGPRVTQITRDRTSSEESEQDR
jgi:hypothetical protein